MAWFVLILVVGFMMSRMLATQRRSAEFDELLRKLGDRLAIVERRLDQLARAAEQPHLPAGREKKVTPSTPVDEEKPAVTQRLTSSEQKTKSGEAAPASEDVPIATQRVERKPAPTSETASTVPTKKTSTVIAEVPDTVAEQPKSSRMVTQTTTEGDAIRDGKARHAAGEFIEVRQEKGRAAQVQKDLTAEAERPEREVAKPASKAPATLKRKKQTPKEKLRTKLL